MNDSQGSVVVGQEGPFDRLAGAVVVPDRDGQCQDALRDADPHSGRGVAAVLLQIELTLERVVDRLDDLAERLEELAAGPGSFALSGRAEQVQPGLRESGLELTAVVVLVRDQDLPGSVGCGQGGVGVEDGEQVWRSSALAPVTANPTGRPCRVHSRCSRSPQKNREWLAQ